MSRRNKHRAEQRQKTHGKKGAPTWLVFLLMGVVGIIGATVLFIQPESFRSNLANSPSSTTSSQTQANARGQAGAPVQSGTSPTTASPSAANVLANGTNLDSFTDAEKAAFYQNAGSQLLQNGQFSEAIAQYRMAVKLNPEDEDTHYNLALALSKGGDQEGAKKEYLESLRIYPDYPEAHNNLGNLLLGQGNTEEAITQFKAAIQASPEDSSAHNNLGHALARQGKIGEAIPEFREAVRLRPDYFEARYNLGEAYLMQKQAKEAVAEFSQILKEQPDFEPAQRGLARARQLSQP